MFIGYARVSTENQSLDLQVDNLKKAGCEKIFSDVASGAKSERPGLKEALNYVRKGDVLVVWKLDRLGRSIKHLIEVVNDLKEKEIGFKSLQESIDTTTPGGKLIFHIFASLAEFEREIIRERTKAGLAAARARGKLGGRPKSLNDSEVKMLVKLHNDPTVKIDDICNQFNISRPTMYRYIRQYKNKDNEKSKGDE